MVRLWFALGSRSLAETLVSRWWRAEPLGDTQLGSVSILVKWLEARLSSDVILSPFGYDLGTVEPSRDSMSRVFLSWLVLSDRDSMSLVVKDNI